MTKHVAILPYVYKPYFDEFTATYGGDLNLVAIDNTKHNAGVAGSWNRGIDLMRIKDADWLIIIGASIRFGEAEASDILEQIEKHKYAHVINFGTKDMPVSNFVRGESPGPEGGNFSWHFCAIRRDVIEKVGYFDPNFHPIYFEDIDYDLRINKAFPDRTWLIVPIDATDVGNGHGISLGGIKSPVEPNLLYFCQKWGRMPHATKLGEYEHPFDDENNSLAYFPPANGRIWNE